LIIANRSPFIYLMPSMTDPLSPSPPRWKALLAEHIPVDPDRIAPVDERLAGHSGAARLPASAGPDAGHRSISMSRFQPD
jgi:hypothetical protein